MKDIYEKNYTQLGPFHVLLIIFGVAIVGAVSSALYEPGLSKDVLGAKDKNPKSQAVTKSAKPESTVQTKGNVVSTSVGNKHKTVMTDVVSALDVVAKTEAMYGNTYISDEVAEVAETAEENADDIAEAVEAVESRPAWKTALLGADYKNLGQLRSSISHITNQIRTLTKAKNAVATQNQAQIDEQLQVLNQEQQRLQTFVHQNESSFGLLGWFSRFLAGYTPQPIGGAEIEVTVPETTTPVMEEPVETTSTMDTGESLDESMQPYMPGE